MAGRSLGSEHSWMSAIEYTEWHPSRAVETRGFGPHMERLWCGLVPAANAVDLDAGDLDDPTMTRWTQSFN